MSTHVNPQLVVTDLQYDRMEMISFRWEWGVGDGDRCGGLHDDGVDGDGFPSANSPSGHLPEAKVWWIFMGWLLVWLSLLLQRLRVNILVEAG